MINQILTGIIGGLAFSLSGLAKKENKEDFDWTKMIPTIVIGGIIGGIAGFMNQDYGVIANSSLAAGLTAVIENGWKAIYRKYLSK
jgi:prolipoprotein diacylglyceryltransferase